MNDAPRIATLIASILVLLIAGSSSAQPWSSHRPDGHAPIGVMGDHTHGAGEMMLSYRYMYMPMDGVLDGTDSIAPASVVAADGFGFMVTPTRMPMQMHMLGAMWAPTNELTLMGMVPFLQMEMDHLTRTGTEFSTESAGIGDVRIVGLYTLARPDRQRLIVQFGASMPTGSIDEKDVTPASASNEVRLPYPMQVGSGTFDLLPGVTYLGQTNEWSWGAQATATVRLGKNDNEYRFGNEGQVTAWGARRLSNAFGVSGRILGSVRSDVVDADPDLNPMMVPTAAAELQSGRRIDSGLGINAVVPSGQLHGLRVALELLVPLYQDVDGPQLGLDPHVIVGVQYAFDL